MTLQCRTPASMRLRENVMVHDSETGWNSTGKDQSKRPIPMDYILEFQSAAQFRTLFTSKSIPELPWVLYVKAVPDEYGFNLSWHKREPFVKVPKGQENWSGLYDPATEHHV